MPATTKRRPNTPHETTHEPSSNAISDADGRDIRRALIEAFGGEARPSTPEQLTTAFKKGAQTVVTLQRKGQIDEHSGTTLLVCLVALYATALVTQTTGAMIGPGPHSRLMRLLESWR